MFLFDVDDVYALSLNNNQVFDNVRLSCELSCHLTMTNHFDMSILLLFLGRNAAALQMTSELLKSMKMKTYNVQIHAQHAY